jgi:hypothetical protein
MGDFFADLRSGIQMPQVVMNQGPLPGSSGLPQPLHDTADGRINYNSSLLGNLTPYAYGEPGYLSSQTAYLNIPHKIQKIVPVVFLPEAKQGATEFFDLSHPVDDGDLAFAMRLDRNSLFCTGLKNGDMRRAGLGTAVDPLINLATVNYILSGVQLGIPATVERLSGGDLWSELLFNLDPARFGKRQGFEGRNYATQPIDFSDVLHIVRHCIRPFGITRGSERQGGQNEATSSPATWPVSFVVSITIDGKEANVMNLWHHLDLNAGDDLVLCLKLMPIRPYTLNHYYKGVKRQSWKTDGITKYVWQLVPNTMHLDGPTKDDEDKTMASRLQCVLPPFRQLRLRGGTTVAILGTTPWQDLGFWHIGRTQVMTSRYGVEEYWHNDLANSLRTNHLDITLQPYFQTLPRHKPRGPVALHDTFDSFGGLAEDAEDGASPLALLGEDAWAADLRLERLQGPSPPPEADWGLQDPVDSGLGLHDTVEPVEPGVGLLDLVEPGPGLEDAAAWTTNLEFADDPVEPGPAEAIEPPSKRPALGGKPKKGGRGGVGGSLLKPDGSSESTMVGML